MKHGEQHQPDTTMDENELIALRRQKLAELRKEGSAYPNDFQRDTLAATLHEQYGALNDEALAAIQKNFRVAGRVMLKRVMGKASFIQLQDMSGRIQLYVQLQEVGEVVYEAFKGWDLGDIVGAEGHLFKTKTGELSLKVHNIRLLTKSLRPLPDKFHGLSDHETRYRQRYVDLMVNIETRETFQIRSNTVRAIRDFLYAHQFLEVETPMMQVLAGGAAAKPFITHHNALDMDLYLRIAPELYLKRLVVGGFERVFELNRNFRNEGVSTRHNPEFTMLEFYQAYSDYEKAMDFTEQLLRDATQKVLGTLTITYQNESIDMAQPFARISLFDSIVKFYPDIAIDSLKDETKLRAWLQQHKIPCTPTDGLGKLQVIVFEHFVESKLIQPTFITAYPTEVSPLARRNDKDPSITDRFELFIAGRELANGFSELNDPEDQASRFEQQMRERAGGDQEAMPFDEDYITALEYGLPPVAGVGIGIDRYVMLLTDAPSIRDVILFPHMRNKS